jgi:hypothetical protein
MEAACSPKKLVSYHITRRRRNPEDYDSNLLRGEDLNSGNTDLFYLF